jgi:hypothetical protein
LRNFIKLFSSGFFVHWWSNIIALEKIKESSQEVYKGEEYLARVKQSKELGIGLNDKTLAYLTAEEYSSIIFNN